MASSKTQPARGMRDFLPADVRRREYVIGIIKEVYERYGFEPLETPAVENIETLLGKYGEEGNQLIFKILKRGIHETTGEADLALRYDLTVPLARVVAEYRDKLPKFFKRYQIQPVWRADRPARGRFREFYQCDVDVLGSRSMIVEAEICAAASEVLKKLGFSNFMVHVNHRKHLTAMLDAVGIHHDDQAKALTALDKLDKIGIDGVRKEFLERGLEEAAADELSDFFKRVTHYAADIFDLRAEGTLYPSQEDVRSWNSFALQEMQKFVRGHPEGEKGLNELSLILDLTAVGNARGRVAITPNLARGLSYYTGAIMEITVPGLSGSLGGGGRYDNLVGMFLGQDVPACGFSLGLERIIVLMTERQMFPPGLVISPADVMVAIWSAKDAEGKMQAGKDSLSLATELRDAGIRTDVYPARNVKLGTQLAYASKRGIPFVAVIGENERARGEVTIKDLRTGEQQSLKRDSVAARLQESL